MEPTPEQLRQEREQLLAHLRATLDEIRLRLHLGGLEARDAWRSLQPELEQSLAQARQLSQDSLARLRLSLRRLLDLRQRLDQPPRPPA